MTTANFSNFERMTNNERLRFCQDLIQEAAHLEKSSGESGGHSSGSKESLNAMHSKSKSSKRPVSVSSALSKKSKSRQSESDLKLDVPKQSTSIHSPNSTTRHAVRYFVVSISKEVSHLVSQVKE